MGPVQNPPKYQKYTQAGKSQTQDQNAVMWDNLHQVKGGRWDEPSEIWGVGGTSARSITLVMAKGPLNQGANLAGVHHQGQRGEPNLLSWATGELADDDGWHPSGSITTAWNTLSGWGGSFVPKMYIQLHFPLAHKQETNIPEPTPPQPRVGKGLSTSWRSLSDNTNRTTSSWGHLAVPRTCVHPDYSWGRGLGLPIQEGALQQTQEPLITSLRRPPGGGSGSALVEECLGCCCPPTWAQLGR